MQERKNCRDKEKGGECSQDQPADHRAAERGILFAAFAKPEGHRQHANDHGQRRHQHRAQAAGPGFQRRCERVDSLRAGNRARN